MDSSLSLGMTKKSARNDHTAVMLNEVKHLPICHAERSEASISGFLTALGMTKKSARNDHTAVMLNEVKHPRFPDLSC
jgi:hypothetical protein